MQLKIIFDYRNIISTVQQIVKTSKFAGRTSAIAIAESILESTAWQVQVQLSKPAAPIPTYRAKSLIELI